MSAPAVELTADELELLEQVDRERVAISRCRYFYLKTGQPPVDPVLIQRLRAMKLVVLAGSQGPRTPPTRKCVLTPAGERVLERHRAS